MAASGSNLAIIAAMVGNGAISISKFVGASLSGSSAMFSEGVHSLVDTGNQVLLLMGIKLSKKGSSAQFPFGRGKEVYFWSFVVSILIFALGGGVSLYEGIHQIMHPTPSESSIVNYIVLILSIFFEIGACYFAFKEFMKQKGNRTAIQAVREGKDPTLFTVLFEDCAAVFGLVVALVGIYLTEQTGNPIYDGIASAIIGLLLISVAIWLALETKGLLIGESASDETLVLVDNVLKDRESIVKVNEVLTMHLGPNEILLNLSIDFKDNINVGELEKIISELTQILKKKDGRFTRVFIEAETSS